MNNKDRFLAFLKAAILILGGSVAIGTSVAVWNAHAGAVPDGFICAIAGVNLIIEGVLFYFLAKKVLYKDEK